MYFTAEAVVTEEVQVVNIVHQYDRLAALQTLIFRQYNQILVRSMSDKETIKKIPDLSPSSYCSRFMFAYNLEYFLSTPSVVGALVLESITACCSFCVNTTECSSFTYSDRGHCYLKSCKSLGVSYKDFSGGYSAILITVL